MSNYATRPIDYGHAIDTSAIDLFGKVATIKQGRYDTNYDLVQQTLNQYGSLANSLVQPAAKEYLAGKLQEVTNTVNNSADTDLSRNGVKNKLLSQVKNVLNDKRVQNDFIDNSNYQNYQRTIAEKKEKHPELYNTANDAYAQTKAGVTDWMSDTTGTKRLGNLNYIDYTDYNKSLVEFSKNLDKYDNEIERNRTDGTYFIKTSGKYLTAEDIKNKVSVLLSDKEKAQIAIDGWAKYENNRNPDEVATEFTKFTANRLNSVQQDINKLQAELANSTDPNEINRLTSEVNNKKQMYSDLTDENNDLSYAAILAKKNTSAMATAMQFEDTVGKFSKAFAFNDVGETLSVDTAGIAKMKEEFKLLTGAKKVDSDNDGIADVIAVPLPLSTKEEKNFLDDTLASAEAKTRAYKNQTELAFNNLDKIYKDVAEATLAKNPKMDRTDFLHSYISSLAKKSSNAVGVGVSIALDKIKASAEEDQSTYVEVMNTATQEKINEVAPKLVEGYLSNPNIKIVQSNGSAVSGAAYLAKNGIKTAADLETPQGQVVKAQLVKSYLADKLLSESGRKVNKYVSSVPIVGSTFTLYNEGKPQNVQDNAVTQDSFEDNPLYPIFQKQFGSDKEAAQFLATAQKNQAYDTNKTADFFTNIASLPIFGAGLGAVAANNLNPDNSVKDDSTLNDALTIDSIKARAAKLVADKKIETRQNGFNIQAKSETGKALIDAIGSNITAMDGTAFVANPNTVMTIKESVNPDFVDITQVQSQSVQGVTTFPEKTARVLKQGLPQQVLERIDFSNQGKVFKNSNIPEISSPAIPISKNDVRRLEDLNNTLLQGQAINYTKENMSIDAFARFASVLGTYKQPTEMGIIADQVINNTNDLPPLQVKLVKTKNGVYTSIVYQKGDYKREIFTSTEKEDENNLDTTYNLVKYTPQIYIKGMIEAMAVNQMRYPDAKNEILENLKLAYAGK